MGKTEREQYQRALLEMIGCRPVAYWPYLARRVGGVKAAVLLSQLLYWNGDPTVTKRDGWVLKSVEDLEAETGLNKVEQHTARAVLSKSGIIECKLKGIPRIWHYRVNIEQLTEILIGKETHSMRNSFNEELIQCESHSMGMTPNIDQESRPMLAKNPAQLNNELKTTDLRLQNEITSSSSNPNSGKRKGKEEEAALGNTVKERLASIGVYKDLYAEIARSGFSEDALIEMISQAEKDEPKTPAAIFMYRVRNTSLSAAPEEREKRNRDRYLSGPYADVISH